MTLLYLVPLLLFLGIGAVMVFLWALQSGAPGQQRRRRLEAAKQGQRSVGKGPGEMPGLPVETAKAKAAPAAQPAPRKRTGTAAE